MEMWNSPSAGQGCQQNGERVQHVCHGVLRPVPYIIYKYNIFYTRTIVINYLSSWYGVCAYALFFVRVCAYEFLRVKTAVGVLRYCIILRLSRSHQYSIANRDIIIIICDF